MSTKQVGEFTVTAVSDGVLYSNHDVILGIDKDESGRLLGIPYGKPVPIDVNSSLIRHNGKLILSDAGTGQGCSRCRRISASCRPICAPSARTGGDRRHHADAPALRPFDGLVDERGKPVFPKAELLIHEVEAAFWLDRTLLPGDSERIVAIPTSSARCLRRIGTASAASRTARCCPVSPR